jgi:hypothetical protein
MSRPQFEVADVFRLYGEEYLREHGASTSPAQKRVLAALGACRTPALGGHIDVCDQCGHETPSYNSCRDRHCPKCLGAASKKWLTAREAELLPVPYFHVVFTLPDDLRPVALQNKKEVYDLLFEAASQTLLQITADPKHLGARVGFMAVLHTWGQTLLDHPHLHAVVPGGGLSPDRTRWIGCREDFLVPVAVLSALFRGKFLALLNRCFERGKLAFHGRIAGLKEPTAFQGLVKRARDKKWVVYAKPPFAGPEQVLRYLARYTHRVAISNHRITSIKDGRVTFRWKDYARKSRDRLMTLDASEFIRRFLLHVLPKGAVRIRYYGLLAHRRREDNLSLCRSLLRKTFPEQGADAPAQTNPNLLPPEPASNKAELCPACKRGLLTRGRELKPFEVLQTQPPAPPREANTS